MFSLIFFFLKASKASKQICGSTINLFQMEKSYSLVVAPAEASTLPPVINLKLQITHHFGENVD